jgi:ABC-type transporter Mla MlaB component
MQHSFPLLPLRHGACNGSHPKLEALTIRINRRETAEGVVVGLHGWLNREVLGELVSLCESVGSPLRMDLSQLAGVDDAGMAFLRSCIAGGARVEGASPYIRLLLDSARALPSDPEGKGREGKGDDS